MTTFGVEFNIGVAATIDVTDERIDAFYGSLANNTGLESVDVAWNETRGTLTALVAVSVPDGFSGDEFAGGVASDAVGKALVDSGFQPGNGEPSPSTRALAFA